MSESNTFRYPHPVDYFGSTLFQVCHFTAHDLHNYKMYDKYVENNLLSSLSSVSDELNSILEKKHESEHEHISEFFYGDFNEYGNIYPSLHRKSMVITLYNFYEHQIETLCREVNKLLQKDMACDYLDEVCLKSFRRFLVREASYSISPGSELYRLWDRMLAVKQIRNVLVHSEGEINRNNVKNKDPTNVINDFCKNTRNITLCGSSINIHEGYVQELITQLIKIFDLLAEQTGNFIRRYIETHGSYEVPLPPGVSRTQLD